MWRSFDELPFLIAEDSEDDLLLLQRALRRTGIPNPQVTTATGQEAIDYLEQALAPDAESAFPVILFLDLRMPRVDGLAVLEWLRDHAHPPITVVLHTGVEDEDMLQQARDLGANYFLPKGARPDAIREVFRRARVQWEQHHLLEH
jgi:CheY-like chemotaxis protein